MKKTPDVSRENRFLGDLAGPLTTWGMTAGLACLVLAASLWAFRAVDATRFLRAYLVAYLFVLSLALGGGRSGPGVSK